MARSTRPRRPPSKTRNRRKPTTAEINEGINNAIEGFHNWDPFDDAAENIGETWRNLRGWHRFANSNGHGLGTFHSWALNNLPLARVPRSLQLGDDIGWSALKSYFPSAHTHFEVERWRLLLYFDNLAQLNIRELIAITKARGELSLNDSYDIVEQHRCKRTRSLGAYKNGQIDFKAFEFKSEDFRACLSTRVRQVKRSYGRNAENIPADDESYRETSEVSNLEDEYANSLDGHEDDLNDECATESDHENDEIVFDNDEGQVHDEDDGRCYAEDDGLIHAEDDGPGRTENVDRGSADEVGQEHAEHERQLYAEYGPNGYDCAEKDIQDDGASGHTTCSLPLQSIFSKFVHAKDEEIRSSQRFVSYGRSLLDKFEMLAQRREVMLVSLKETEESIYAEIQAVSRGFLLSHENFRPQDGEVSDEALPRFKSEVSRLGSLLHKRRIDGEELANNEVKRVKIESDIAKLMTWPEDDARRRLVPALTLSDPEAG